MRAHGLASSIVSIMPGAGLVQLYLKAQLNAKVGSLSQLLDVLFSYLPTAMP